jgi:AraC family L-rhamnose operon transcriptional activator RhaR
LSDAAEPSLDADGVVIGGDAVLAGGAAVAAARVRVDGDLERHAHDFVELALVLGGSGRHETIHGAERIGEGDAIVVPVGSWHAFSDCAGLDVVNCYVRRQVLDRELGWALEDASLGPLLAPLALAGEPLGPRRVRLDAAATGRCADLLAQLGTGAGPGRIEAVGRLLIVLGTIAASHGPAATTRRLRPAVAATIRLLQADLARQWTIAELAEAAYVHRSHLARVFRHDTGLSPSTYLLHLRLERAASLLLATDHDVGGIAASVGFLDASYFARRFRAHFGTSPTAYRARGLDGAVSTGT